MSNSLGALNIQLTLDQVQFQSALTKAQARAKQFSEDTTRQLNNIEKATQSLNKSILKADFLGTLGIQLGAFKSAAQFAIKQADSYTELRNKISLVTASETEHARAMADIFDISKRTAQSLEATSSVY